MGLLVLYHHPCPPSSACACQNCVTKVLRKSKDRHGQYINTVYKLALSVPEPPVSAFASITHQYLPSPPHFHLHTTCNTQRPLYHCLPVLALCVDEDNYRRLIPHSDRPSTLVICIHPHFSVSPMLPAHHHNTQASPSLHAFAALGWPNAGTPMSHGTGTKALPVRCERARLEGWLLKMDIYRLENSRGDTS